MLTFHRMIDYIINKATIVINDFFDITCLRFHFEITGINQSMYILQTLKISFRIWKEIS